MQTGLANRVVPKGRALEEALKLANQIAAFPQACLNADRRSAYYAAYKADSFAGAMTYEYHRALPVSTRVRSMSPQEYVKKKRVLFYALMVS